MDFIGRGPGEFLLLVDITIDSISNSIIAADIGNKKILVYSLDNGSFIKEMKCDFDFNKFAYSGEHDIFIFFTPNQQSNIIYTDGYLNKIGEAFNPNENIDRVYMGNEGRFFEGDKDKVYYNPKFSSTIYQLNFNYSAQPIFSLKDQSTPTKSIEKYVNKKPNQKMLNSLNRDLPIKSFIINSEYIVIEKANDQKFGFLLFDYIHNKSKIIMPSIKTNNYGQKFNFIFGRPLGVYNNYFITIITPDLYITILENIDIVENMNHIPKLEYGDNPMLMLYDLN